MPKAEVRQRWLEVRFEVKANAALPLAKSIVLSKSPENAWLPRPQPISSVSFFPALVGLLALVTLGAALHTRRVRRPAPDGAPPSTPSKPLEGSPPRPRDPRPFEVPTPRTGNGASPVSLSEASYDELRELGMSMTQANRVLRYRERNGSFASVDDLRDVGGFPRDLLAELRRRAVA